MQIDLTQDEAQALLNICDVATRAQGINIAQIALPLAIKIQLAINENKIEEVSTDPITTD